MKSLSEVLSDFFVTMPVFLKAPFTTIFNNRRLVAQLTKRKIESRYKGSLLGYLWIIIDPLLMLGIYLFVFGYIFSGTFESDGAESKINYALTLFIGLAFHRLFADILITCSSSVLSNANFVKKIVFPLEVLPLIDIFRAIFSFSISMTFIFLFKLLIREPFDVLLLWWLYLISCFVLFSFGIGWGVSAVTVYLRDIRNGLQFISIGLMFGSAIFYPVEKIPLAAWTVLKYNPILHFVDIAREVTMWNEVPDSSAVMYLGLVSIATCYVGYGIFVGLRKGFADVL